MSVNYWTIPFVSVQNVVCDLFIVCHNEDDIISIYGYL